MKSVSQSGKITICLQKLIAWTTNDKYHLTIHTESCQMLGVLYRHSRPFIKCIYVILPTNQVVFIPLEVNSYLCIQGCFFLKPKGLSSTEAPKSLSSPLHSGSFKCLIILAFISVKLAGFKLIPKYHHG